MFLSRILISNFRNFHHADISLGPTSVIVGENAVGKSNLIHALRLILDPRLSESNRRLSEDDFWDGLESPIKGGEVIEVSIEFQDFQNQIEAFAVLQPYCVEGTMLDTARITYRFQPGFIPQRNRDITIDDYEYVIFGGVDESIRVDVNLRRWMPLEVLPALRDAESDLATWRRSPLRPLVEKLVLSDETLSEVATAIDEATGRLLEESEIQRLINSIRERLSAMIGNVATIDPTLAFTATSPERIARNLRLFGDGEMQRLIAELSLGVNNILYLVLLALDLELKESEAERAATILAIEEPEAHLHPHLQRLVFRDFLRRKTPLLMTTHSPHVASVAPLESVVVLRNRPDGSGSEGNSTVAAGFSTQEIEDLERYLDATRAEILFARGVILVEGSSELFLVPALAAKIGRRLDEYGVTVCNVHGTDFVPYAKLLGCNGLNIPFVAITDGDRRTSNDQVTYQGLERAIRIASAKGLHHVDVLNQSLESGEWATLRDDLRQIGIFVGERTLEVDLFDQGHGPELIQAVAELGAGNRTLERLEKLVTSERDLDEDQARYLLGVIERYGKGRVAQRLAGKMDPERSPAFVKDAVSAIVEGLAHD